MTHYIGQECLQSNSNNGVPPTQLYGMRRSIILPGYQAIIPSYQFQCYGNITQWVVAMRSAGTEDCHTIDIELQVWRPSTIGNSHSRRFYNKVGANTLILSVRTTLRIVQRHFDPYQQIEVAPGDVLGFQIFNPEDGDENHCNERIREEEDDIDIGVVTLNYISGTKTNEEVWDAYTNNRVNGRASVDVGSNGTLNRLTDAAPVISASVIVLNISTSKTTTSVHSVAVIASPTLIGQMMRDDEGKRRNKIIVAATTTAGILLVTVSITIIAVIGICTVFRKRAKSRTLTRTSQGVAQAERNTSFYSEDVVKHVHNRDPVQMQRTQAVIQQLNQQTDTQDMQLQVIPGPSGFGTGDQEIELSNSDSNMDSIITRKNEAYGKVTFTDSGDYENDYENDYYHEYDYI